MKYVAFIVPFLVGIVTGAFLFFVLILVLNGYSERQATPGLIFFLVWVLLCSLISGALSVTAANLLVGKRFWRPVKAALASAAALSCAGVAVTLAGLFAAVLLVEMLR